MVLKYKLFSSFIIFLGILTFGVSVVSAENPSLSLYPSTGTVQVEKDFLLDILVDTKGERVTLVRAVLTFDPELVQVKTAQRNEDIFCEWPSNEQLIDNEQGVVMATGFCQSGVNELYATSGEPDTFVRLTFETLREGDLVIDWEYTGRDEDMQSVIMKDGSPPQNILVFDSESDSELQPGVYTIGEESDIEKPETGKTPDTGIPVFENISTTFIFGGLVFFLALVTNVLLDPKRRYFSKSRTIVVYDDEEK